MTTSAQDSISDQSPNSAQDSNSTQAPLIAQATIYDTVVELIAKAEPLKKKKKTIFSAFSNNKLSEVRILPTTKLSDIRMDSLEKLSIAMDLEEIYDLYIPDEAIEAFTFVSDIPAYLENAIANKKALAEAVQERIGPKPKDKKVNAAQV